jgi:uncharacterized protein (TIGR02270 family)
MLVVSPAVRLTRLSREDERLGAYIEALHLAGAHGKAALLEAFASLGFGEVFPATTIAVESQDVVMLERVAGVARTKPELESAFVAAFTWVSRGTLTGLVRRLFGIDAFWRRVALAACGEHGVTPLAWIAEALAGETQSRCAALRVAGEGGSLESLPAIRGLILDDADTRVWAALAGVLLGERGRALETLAWSETTSEVPRTRALSLALQAMDQTSAHARLEELARKPEMTRELVCSSGIVGDPAYVPWLMERMIEPQVARLAGEAFSLMTGADLDRLQLWCEPPESPDADVADESNAGPAAEQDDDLPWPDRRKVEQWWSAHRHGFQNGQRYFMGAPVTWEHSLHVLRTGHQRQRVLAAQYLCLLNPGTPLFNTSAPAWRQQRLLAQMT